QAGRVLALRGVEPRGPPVPVGDAGEDYPGWVDVECSDPVVGADDGCVCVAFEPWLVHRVAVGAVAVHVISRRLGLFHGFGGWFGDGCFFGYADWDDFDFFAFFSDVGVFVLVDHFVRLLFGDGVVVCPADSEVDYVIGDTLLDEGLYPVVECHDCSPKCAVWVRSSHQSRTAAVVSHATSRVNTSTRRGMVGFL